MIQENLKLSQETQNLQLPTINCSYQEDLEKELQKSNDSLLWSYVSNKKKSVVKNLLNNSFPKPNSSSSRRSQSDSFSSTDISRCESPQRKVSYFTKSRFADSIYEPVEVNNKNNMENELASPMLPKLASFLDDEDNMEEETNCFDFVRVVKSTDNSSEKNINMISSRTIVSTYVQDKMTAIEFQKKSSKSFKRSQTMILDGALTQKSSQSGQQQSPRNFASAVKSIATSPKANPIQKAQPTRIPKLYLKCDGKKSGLVMFNIARFQQMIESKIDAKTYREFLDFVQKMLDNYEKNEEIFKTSHGESLAASILLLAASKVGVSKTDFLEALKPWNKKMFTKVEMIKKNACYKLWKKIFIKIVA